MVVPKKGVHSSILEACIVDGGASRAELQRLTGLRPNTVCDAVDAMVDAGWLTESGKLDQPGDRRGRPAVRVGVDRERREVIGLALLPSAVEVTRLNLVGEAMGRPLVRPVSRSAELGRVAARAVRGLISERTLAVGVSATGLIDEGDMKLLLSSSAPEAPGLSLGPVLSAIGELPMALENDIHALGDRWRLANPEASEDTTLLVELGDGAVGASIMTAGRPADAGCVRGGNELGHMQVAALGRQVPACYCGQPRCLERVFSSAMVQALEGSRRRLTAALLEWGKGKDTVRITAETPGLEASSGGWIVSRLSEAMANTINLIRPHRVVWVDAGRLSGALIPIEERLTDWTRRRLMPVLAERVRFESWAVPENQISLKPAVTAGYLALAMLTGQRRPACGEVTLNPAGQPAA